MKTRNKTEAQVKRIACDLNSPPHKKPYNYTDCSSSPISPQHSSCGEIYSGNEDFDSSDTSTVKIVNNTIQNKKFQDDVALGPLNAVPTIHLLPSKGSVHESKKSFIAKLNANFVDTIILGLESSLRSDVRLKLEKNSKLTPKQNKSVIAAVNHLIFEYVGYQRPDMELCRYILCRIKGFIILC